MAAQAASGAGRYDVGHDPARRRWYIDASSKADPHRPVPGGPAARHPVLAMDLNHGHLAAQAATPDGNPDGRPVTVPGPGRATASQRDGRLRAAISSLTRLARRRGCRAGVIEDLTSLTPASGTRAAWRTDRGARTARKGLPALVAGIPTGKFRDRLTQMTANAASRDRGRPGLRLPLGARALARPAAGSSVAESHHRPSCGRSGNRQACARPPGAATGQHDRRRPRIAAGELPEHRGQANNQERTAPPGQAAATPVAEDRDGQPDPPARPGDPRPSGAAG